MTYEYPKLISGEKIMRFWRVDALRIFDLFADGGLQPYRPTGREFRLPVEYHKYSLRMKEHKSLFQQWENITKKIESFEHEAQVLDEDFIWEEFKRQKADWEKLTIAIRSAWEDAQRIKQEDPELRLWKYFEKDAVDDEKLQELINQVVNLQFDMDQVQRYFPMDELDEKSKREALADINFSTAPERPNSAITGSSRASVPEFSFYQDGSMWAIGRYGKEHHFKHRKGFAYIHFLLQHRNQQVLAEIAYNLGKFEAPSDTFDENVVADLRTFDGPSYPAIPGAGLDGKALGDAVKAIDGLKKRRDSAEDPTEREEWGEKIKHLEKYIQEGKRNIYTKEHENARKNLEKNISAAKEAIQEQLTASAPELIEELGYVKTGHYCFYSGQAEWKFYHS